MSVVDLFFKCGQPSKARKPCVLRSDGAGVDVRGEGLTYSETLSIILLILHEPYCDGNTAALHPSRPRTWPFLRRLELSLVRYRVLKSSMWERSPRPARSHSDSLTNDHH